MDINKIIFIFTLMITFTYATITVSIDIDKNLPGTTTDTLVGFGNQINDFYFLAVGEAAQYSTYTFQDISATPGYVGSIIPIIKESTDVIIRLTIDRLIADIVGNNLILEIRVNDTSDNSLFFGINAIEDVVLLNCLNDFISLKVPPTRNNTFVAILGQESNELCHFKIVLNNDYLLQIPMSVCGILFNTEFLLRITKLSNVEGLDDDINARLTCKQQVDSFVLSDKDLVSKYIESESFKIYETQVQAVMFLHQPNDKTLVITNEGIDVKTDVSLRITLDNMYIPTYDILPLVCAANDIIIMGHTELPFSSLNKHTNFDGLSNIACANAPFNNFTKVAIGDYRSDFKMFRTITNGVSDSSVKFACLIYVCKNGSCPTTSCVIMP